MWPLERYQVSFSPERVCVNIFLPEGWNFVMMIFFSLFFLDDNILHLHKQIWNGIIKISYCIKSIRILETFLSPFPGKNQYLVFLKIFWEHSPSEDRTRDILVQTETKSTGQKFLAKVYLIQETHHQGPFCKQGECSQSRDALFD